MIAEEIKRNYQGLFNANKFTIEDIKDEIKTNKKPKEVIEKLLFELEKREESFELVMKCVISILEDLNDNLITKEGNFLPVGLFKNWNNGKKYFQFAERLKDKTIDLANNINNSQIKSND